jgi:hypothetical protein
MAGVEVQFAVFFESGQESEPDNLCILKRDEVKRGAMGRRIVSKR